MKVKSFLLVFFVLLVCAQLCLAGTLSGKVSGAAAGSVVWVEDPSAKVEVPAKPFVIDQKGLLFIPHVVVVPVGSSVDFLNSDSVAHNVFWTNISGDKKLGHNLGTWPKGEKRSFTFDKAGVAPVLCNVHPDMAGYVIISPTPYFAETDDSGTYKIKDVPDGSYTLVVWHEGAKAQSKPMTVAGGGKADFTVSK